MRAASSRCFTETYLRLLDDSRLTPVEVRVRGYPEHLPGGPVVVLAGRADLEELVARVVDGKLCHFAFAGCLPEPSIARAIRTRAGPFGCLRRDSGVSDTARSADETFSENRPEAIVRGTRNWRS
jgi:hypothetical protein